MRFSAAILGLHAFGVANAAPLEERQNLVGGLVTGVTGTVDDLVRGLLGDLDRAVKNGDRDGALNAMRELQVSKKAPSDVEDAFTRLQTIATNDEEDQNLVDYAGQLIANGLILGSVGDLFDYAKDLASAENSSKNRYISRTLVTSNVQIY